MAGKNFKPGQKVVFSLKRLRLPLDLYQAAYPWALLPEEGDILTVVQRSTSEGFWIIKEFPFDRRNRVQGISDLVLFPIESVHAEFNESLLLKIEKSIYKPALI